METICRRGGLLILVAAASTACAQSPARDHVVFQLNQTTTVGRSVFVSGDVPELGSNDLRNAVKLDPSAYPLWRATVAIPRGRSYSYRYYLRDDAPGRTSDATNGTPIGSILSASTSPATLTPPTKTIFLTWNISSPHLYWRQGTAPFEQISMSVYGPSRAGEVRYFAWGFGQAGRDVDFYFTDSAGNSRYPASGFYTTRSDAVYVQDGNLYSYIPAASVSPARRDYNPAAVPTLFSSQLNESRGYRVWLPRGYSEHPSRRFPVLYMHDGQNIFESGPFGSWNAAPTFTNLTNSGQIRELIVVALDNGPNRLTDYLPPDDSFGGPGRGDRYAAYIRDTVKPFIDSNYRTIPDAASTGALGSSMGGVISLYLGWDYTTTFTRLGLMSGAWQTCNNFLTRVRATPGVPPRPVQMWFDSGDSGSSNDNYWLTYGLRDFFIGGTSSRYAMDGTIDHMIGFGQQHNEAAWSSRLPSALKFLYPADDEANILLRTVFGPQFDLVADGSVDAEDLYEQERSPRDLNLNGATDSLDAAYLKQFLRRNESAGLLIR